MTTYSIPYLGAGLSYRRQLAKGIFSAKDSIDLLEIISEHFFHQSLAEIGELERLCTNFTLIPHGLNLSIGSSSAINRAYLRQVQDLVERVKPPYYSDHLAITRVGNIELGHLTPIWYDRRNLQLVIDNINRIQDILGLPLVLETITYNFEIGLGDLRQTEFITSIVDATNCGILLDITNVYINATNHNFDPMFFIDDLPLQNIFQLHLVGYEKDGNGNLVDSHGAEIQDEIWQLLESVVAKAPIRAIVLERDNNLPPVANLVSELNKARNIVRRR